MHQKKCIQQWTYGKVKVSPLKLSIHKILVRKLIITILISGHHRVPCCTPPFIIGSHPSSQLLLFLVFITLSSPHQPQSSSSSQTQEEEKNLPAPFEEWIHSTCLCGICVRSKHWRMFQHHQVQHTSTHQCTLLFPHHHNQQMTAPHLHTNRPMTSKD